jgi:hypothetical protein
VDETSAFPSDHFGPAAMEALAKAGTVTLPSPPPASGMLYLGINPDHNPDLPSVGPRYYLRLVQTVSPMLVVTRIVGLNDFRGISLPAPAMAEGRASRQFRTVNGVHEDIKSAIDTLAKAEAKNPGVYEVLLFKDAVIYVPESAPVFMRIQHNLEHGVSAADAAEHVEAIWAKSGCHTCPAIPPRLPPLEGYPGIPPGGPPVEHYPGILPDQPPFER